MPRIHRARRALSAFMAIAVACSGGKSSTDGAAGSLTFRVERNVAEATISMAEGGNLSATAADGSTFELVVPPKAVAEDTRIQMSPLADVKGLGEGAVHAVQLKPEGLLLFDFARLTITPASPIPVADQLMFEATGKGVDPGPALLDQHSKPIVLLLEHFSVNGVADVTPEQRAIFLEKSASNAQRRIRDEVSKRLGAAREKDLTGQGADVPPDLSDLVGEFNREVVEKRREAATLSCGALKTYLRTVIRFEKELQLLGMSKEEEAASLQRIADAVKATEGQYQECEKEAIVECQKEKDPSILVKFWLAMERPADAKRAEAICEPKGYQFEFSGSGTAIDDGNQIPNGVMWHYWGLICEGSDKWKIWEDYDLESGIGSHTGPPGDGRSVPYQVTFGSDGSVTSISGQLARAQDRTTAGTILKLSPGERPTSVDAVMGAGDGTTIRASAPVVPADGSIEPCE